MPEEVMLVAIVAIIASSIIILKIVGMIAGWLSGSSKKSDDSLTAGELDRLVRAAVRSETRELHEETRELHHELRRLQRRVEETRRLEPPEDPHRYGLLADSGSIEDEPERPA